MKLIFGIALFSMIGCSSIKNVDTSGADPTLLRGCVNTYSMCASGGPSVGFKTETLSACKEAYEVCVSTCKVK